MKVIGAIFFCLVFFTMQGQMKKSLGKDIYVLIGKELTLSETGGQIDFDEYSIVSGGGHLIVGEQRKYNEIYSIQYWHSDKESYYLFAKKSSRFDNYTVTDVLTIPRKNVVKYKVIDIYCETLQGADPEIIALVKDKEYNPEYYTKIVKAWRANRNTGKFEVVTPSKVKRCGNEGYGADED